MWIAPIDHSGKIDCVTHFTKTKGYRLKCAKIPLPHLTDTPHNLKLINEFIYTYIHTLFKVFNFIVLYGYMNKAQ